VNLAYSPLVLQKDNKYYINTTFGNNFCQYYFPLLNSAINNQHYTFSPNGVLTLKIKNMQLLKLCLKMIIENKTLLEPKRTVTKTTRGIIDTMFCLQVSCCALFKMYKKLLVIIELLFLFNCSFFYISRVSR